MEFLTTVELAALFRVKPQTILKSFCLHGHYMGLVPRTLPNHRHLWAEEPAKKLLNPEESFANGK